MCILNILIVASSELSIFYRECHTENMAKNSSNSLNTTLHRHILYVLVCVCCICLMQISLIYIRDQFCCKVFCLKYLIYNKRIINHLYCVRFVCMLEVCSLACHGHLCVNNNFAVLYHGSAVLRFLSLNYISYLHNTCMYTIAQQHRCVYDSISFAVSLIFIYNVFYMQKLAYNITIRVHIMCLR